MEPLTDPIFLAWMGSWEARGDKIVAVDTTAKVCTGAKEIIEKIMKKSLVKSHYGRLHNALQVCLSYSPYHTGSCACPVVPFKMWSLKVLNFSKTN